MQNSEDGFERTSEYFVFKKKGGFINSFSVDLRLSQDRAGNVFLVLVVKQTK